MTYSLEPMSGHGQPTDAELAADERIGELERELAEARSDLSACEQDLAAADAQIAEDAETVELAKYARDEGLEDGRREGYADALELVRDCDRGLYTFADTIRRLAELEREAVR
jgi:flagellar biosynthesis/type III secretory pathway protein FliH